MDPPDDVTATAVNGDAPAALTTGDENATNRRKSGRVTKKPNIYAEEAAIALNGGKGKRKRVMQNGGTEDQVDASGDESSELSEAEGSEAEEETAGKRRRRSGAGRKAHADKPAAKKPRTVAGTGAKTLAVRSAAGQSAPKARRRRGTPGDADVEGESLFADVFSNGRDLDAVAAGWASRYEQNNAEAISELVNFVLETAGCDLKVTVHDVEDQDNVTGKLSDLQDEYQAQNITDYPLVARARGHPPFRATLLGFFHSLIATIDASSILYSDPALVENIQVWVTTMSSSAIRPFRHTATVISLAMVSSLCEVALEIAEGNAKTLRQIEGEKKKRPVNKGRITSLQQKVDEGAQKGETVEGTIRDIFDTVFVHRYRDVDPKIRADCVQAIGHWIITLPDVFFEGKYLRYLGWVLSDVSAPTRLEVIKQLQRLFKSKDNVGGLRTFTERFRPRLVEMAVRDADLGVRASTVELLDMIRATDLLEPDDIDTIGRLLFDSEAKVRKTVVGFVAENINDLYEAKIEDLGGEEAIEPVLAREGEDDFDNPRLSWLKIKCLVEILQSYDSEDRGELPSQVLRGPASGVDVLVAGGVDSRFSFAAQAMCDRISDLKEWEILAGYLLFDHSERPTRRKSRNKDDVEAALKEACKLTEKEEIILLDVLLAAVKLSLTHADEVEVAKKGPKKKKTAKGDVLEAQEKTARHLAQLIPRLLNKFGATPATAAAVLRLEQVLDLDVFQELRQDSTTYSSLLDDINKQFLTHADQSVLVEASAALLHAKSFEELEEVTEEKMQHLWEDTTNTFQALSDGIDVGARGNLDADVLTGMLNTARRISNLASISDCVDILERDPGGAGAHLDTLIRLLGRGIASNAEEGEEGIEDMEDELTTCALKSVFFYFMWKTRAIKLWISRGGEGANVERWLSNGPGDADLDFGELARRRSAFSDALIAIVRLRSGVDTLRLTAAGHFLDLYTLLSTLRQPKGFLDPFDARPGQILALVNDISADDQETLMSVYSAAEKAYAKKAGRILDVAEDDEPLDDEPDSDPDEEDDGEEAERGKHHQALVHEQRLCELVSKIVLAVIARVFDESGGHEGKLRRRLNQNRGRLGQNYKEVVAYLDEPKSKRGKKKGNIKTSEAIAVESNEEDEIEEVEDPPSQVEEGGEEDLRNRELALDDIDADSGGVGEEVVAADVEDEIMGD
ncbi:MAG: hypothetical protein M1832_001902 [Thelocarpon impressellum]|nr:MAG: hypothetical protein M1832_001902 [Thelocarpon impressellum]